MGEKSGSRGGWFGWFIVLIVVAVIAVAIALTVKQKMHKNGSDFEAAPVPGPPGAVTQKYADALKTAMQFLEIQKGLLSLSFSVIFPF